MALEILTFFGLAMLLEGVLLALFPGAMQRMMAQFAVLAPSQLRNIGLGFAIAAALALALLSRFSGGPEGRGIVFGFSETRHLIAGLF